MKPRKHSGDFHYDAIDPSTLARNQHNEIEEHPIERLNLDETQNLSITKEMQELDLQTNNLMNLAQREDQVNKLDYALIVNSMQGGDKLMNQSLEEELFDPFLRRNPRVVKATTLVNQPVIAHQQSTAFSPNTSNIMVLGQSQVMISNRNNGNEASPKVNHPDEQLKNFNNKSQAEIKKIQEFDTFQFLGQHANGPISMTERATKTPQHDHKAERHTEGQFNQKSYKYQKSGKARSNSPHRNRLPFIFNDNFKAEYVDNLNESSIMDLDGQFKNKTQIAKKTLQRIISTCHDFGDLGKARNPVNSSNLIPDERPDKMAFEDRLKIDLKHTEAIKEKVKKMETAFGSGNQRGSN